ncbi:hypothetical protein [Amycolatopsis nigrescens]|uniref:hypothetical protein n=1 Tax=Amycolatopsis nigrescens TaxID=381445 RepID=UPI0012FAD7DD|nr:hypothetical protein [Amycolatopsis nigrescens]
MQVREAEASVCSALAAAGLGRKTSVLPFPGAGFGSRSAGVVIQTVGGDVFHLFVQRGKENHDHSRWR